MKPFSSILQYFFKNDDSSLDISFMGKDALLTQDHILYNDDKFYSFSGFAQKVCKDISQIFNSKKMSDIIINGKKYNDIRDDLSRNSKMVILSSYTNTSKQIEINPKIESIDMDITEDIKLSSFHLSNGNIQLGFFSRKDVYLNILVKSETSKIEISLFVKQDEHEFFDTDISSINNILSINIEEKVSNIDEYFKFIFDSTNNNVLAFIYPENKLWGKGKAYNKDNKVNYDKINTTKIISKNQDNINIEWNSGISSIQKTDLFVLTSNNVSYSNIVLDKDTPIFTHDKNDNIITGFMISKNKDVILTNFSNCIKDSPVWNSNGEVIGLIKSNYDDKLPYFVQINKLLDFDSKIQSLY